METAKQPIQDRGKLMFEKTCFRSSYDLARQYQLSPNSKAMRIIRNQSGYVRGSLMAVSKTVNGGYRLYERVQGHGWVDSSLEDIHFPDSCFIHK